MKATIYIRKENEDWWKGLSAKSDWVNLKLEEDKPGAPIRTDGTRPVTVVVDYGQGERVAKETPFKSPYFGK